MFCTHDLVHSDSDPQIGINVSILYVRRRRLKENVQISQRHNSCRLRTQSHICLVCCFAIGWFLPAPSQGTCGNICRHFSLSQTGGGGAAGMWIEAFGVLQCTGWQLPEGSTQPQVSIALTLRNPGLVSWLWGLPSFIPKDKMWFPACGLDRMESYQRAVSLQEALCARKLRWLCALPKVMKWMWPRRHGHPENPIRTLACLRFRNTTPRNLGYGRGWSVRRGRNAGRGMLCPWEI